MEDKKKFLEAIDKIGKIDELSFKPQFFGFDKKDIKEMVTLIDKGLVSEIVDTYDDQIDELSEVKKPSLIFEKNKRIKKQSDAGDGLWVYFLWKRKLVHLLDKKSFKKLRLSRNFNLVTAEEQKKLDKSVIGFAGMNVGASGAVCMALEGVSSLMKFADFDTLSVSNLNRFRSGVCELGINKAILTARHVMEINPYMNLKLFPKGIDDKNIESFLLKPKVDVLIEETDNLQLKIKIRELAKKHRIPVVMVTGNGPNLILDIERYDLNKSVVLLNGNLKKEIYNKIINIRKETPVEEIVPLLRDFIGSKNLTKRLNESFNCVGKTLAGVPQLGETTFLRGAVLTYVAKKIILGEKVSSGRHSVRLDGII